MTLGLVRRFPWLGKMEECFLHFLAFLISPFLLLRYRMHGCQPRRLHFGCGKVRLAGWINADLSPFSDLVIDIRKKLPFPSEHLEFAYSEHVLEHVSFEVGVSFLIELHRTLAPFGTVRIAMPDLDDLVDGYLHDWHRFDWVKWESYTYLETRAQMINLAFRGWGHEHLYNREELGRALRLAGFTEIKFKAWGASDIPELAGLETRKDSLLIVEAQKTL
jgi:predicted SAM-dependent methyltransferase